MAANDSFGNFERNLASAFAASGFELFVVGGAVRNELLGREVSELDFATNARPPDIREVLERMNGVHVYRVGEKFGTIGAVLEDMRVEITTYRSAETYPTGSRKPEVQFGHTLTEDLSRRDFRMNAIARIAGEELGDSRLNIEAEGPANPRAGLIDPFNGLFDLEHRLVTTVRDPSARFEEDPLRLLRGVRFAAGLRFDIEAQTWEAMKAAAHLLARISRERIADELTKMLSGPDPARALRLLRGSGLLSFISRELLTLTSMSDHGPRHPLSLWDHTMAVVAGVAPDELTRWAALLHDIGKPSTKTFDATGRIRFPNHDHIGAEIAREILQSLRLSGESVAAVYDLVDTHMQLHQYTAEWSDGAVRRLLIRLGPNFQRALDLARADACGHGETSWGISKVEALTERAGHLRDAVPHVTSPLNGREIMERYARDPGPWVGRIKDELEEEVLEGRLRVDDKARAWEVADRLAKSL